MIANEMGKDTAKKDSTHAGRMLEQTLLQA